MNDPNVGKGAVQALILAETEKHSVNPKSSLARIPLNRLFYPVVATETNEQGDDVIPENLKRYRLPKKPQKKAKAKRRTYR